MTHWQLVQVTEVSVVIPSIPPRKHFLTRALKSVVEQNHPAHAIHVAIDIDKQGAAITRDRALAAVTTEWVAFLDDDDTMNVDHLSTCLMAAESTDADLVYPWFEVVGGTDPFPIFWNQPWDPANPHQVPITFVAKTELVREAGCFTKDWDVEGAEDVGYDEYGNRAGEDLRFIYRFNDLGFKIVHHPVRSWNWFHNTSNTSGLPSRW